jgi:hypothetical protein
MQRCDQSHALEEFNDYIKQTKLRSFLIALICTNTMNLPVLGLLSDDKVESMIIESKALQRRGEVASVQPVELEPHPLLLPFKTGSW